MSIGYIAAQFEHLVAAKPLRRNEAAEPDRLRYLS